MPETARKLTSEEAAAIRKIVSAYKKASPIGKASMVSYSAAIETMELLEVQKADKEEKGA